MLKKQHKLKFILAFSLSAQLFACVIPSTATAEAIPFTSSSSSPSSSQQQQQQSQRVKCKNEQGEDVDWFIAYKLPKDRISSNALVRAGLAYAYIVPPDSSSSSPSTWLPKPEVKWNITEKITADDDSRDISAVKTSSSLHSNKEERSYSKGHEKQQWREVHTDTYRDHGPEFKKSDDETISAKFAAGAGVPGWILSEKGIDSPGSMVGQTLGRLYLKKWHHQTNKQEDDDNAVAFLTYNDQSPVGPTVVSGGHSKGIVLTSLASGFWIQHSVPHFPLIDHNNLHYQYPNTGKTNGQIFHCISLPSSKEVDRLGGMFDITKPHVVNFSFPTDSLKTALPKLLAIANHHKHKDGHHLTPPSDVNNPLINWEAMQQLSEPHPCENEIDDKACLLVKQLNANQSKKGQSLITLNITLPLPDAQLQRKLKQQNWDELDFVSEGGKSFHAFIKGPSFNEDIFSSQIAPKYRSELNMQSWLNGPNPFPSNCTSKNYSVYNILDTRIEGSSFSTHNDHSKYALSSKLSNGPLVCISDLNRMEHQLKRGGVAVCFMDLPVWSTFNSSIIDVQPCPRLYITAAKNASNEVENDLIRDSLTYFSVAANNKLGFNTWIKGKDQEPGLSLSLSSAQTTSNKPVVIAAKDQGELLSATSNAHKTT